MAAVAAAATADMTIQKDSEILVKVEEALADLIVVSYSTEDKKFQGVLLDANKGNLPYGVYSLHPAFSKEDTSSIKDEKLHSVSQRFTYQEPQYATQPLPTSKKTGSKPKNQARQKMTVRLRPRKVLCSNCKGICNENSENVDVKKRKLMTSDDHMESNDHSESFIHDAEKKFLMGSMLIPKLSRLHPSEISNAIKGTKKSAKVDSTKASDKSKNVKSENCDNIDNRVVHEVAFVNVAEDINVNCDNQTDSTMKHNTEMPFNSIFSNAKTIKISFGAGEGTVVKIPPIVGDFNEDSGVCDMAKQSELKAAKKALKKAKKQAKRSILVKDIRSGLSPKHIGALSPRNTVSDGIINPELVEKKQKHKVKHKKRHKIQKERDENTSKCLEKDSINYFSDIKDCCENENLSLNLRRISSNSYEKQKDDETDSGSEGWESDTVPDFPESGLGGAGTKHVRVSPGDIVWGKVVGFPWWPGRVLSVTPTSRAHVAWFASTTSSLMPCDSLSPFLEDYKIRFNKKKKGPYKEAVKQATIEAKQLEESHRDPLASSPQNHPTASPRPINVFS